MTWTTQPRSDFGGLAAIDAGAGPRLLLLHGVGLRAEAWSRQIEALSAEFRTIAVDLPGHGQSPMPIGAQSLSDYTEAVAAGLTAPTLVIGHSMGAMIALDLATRFAERVRGVATLNAIFKRSAEAKRAVQARAALLDGVQRSDPSTTLERWFGAEAPAEREACHDWLREVDSAAYQTAYRIFAHHDGPDEAALKALDCPALFLTGEEEPNSLPKMSHQMASLAPAGQAHIVRSAAHMMPMTHAAEVNDALLNFARKVWVREVWE